MERIKALYAQHKEIPYISPDRNIDQWLQAVSISKEKLVPKRNMERTEEGLLPGHLILLWRVRFGTYTNQTVISKYFEYTYGIDAKSDIDWLIQEGYAIEESPFSSLDHLTAGQLKQLLTTKNVSGLAKKKRDEIEALIPVHFTQEELGKCFDVRGYALTQKGEEILNKYPEILSRHPQKKM